MESNPRSETFNPYAAPASTTERMSAIPLARVGFPFAGQVEESQLRNYYNEPYHFGCLFTLLLICGGVWTVAMGVAFGGLAGTLVAMATALLAFWFGALFFSDWRLRQCLRLRPWLVGEVHGHVSTGRLTVWHADVCVQTIDHSRFDPMKRGCLSILQNGYPLVWVPNRCFYDDQWRELAMELRQSLRLFPLVIEAPPTHAHRCVVPLHRLGFLRNRVAGLKSRVSADMLWMTFGISGIVILLFPMHSVIGIWGCVAFPMVTWVILKFGRLGWCQWSLQSQFNGPASKAYKEEDKAACSQFPHFLLQSWFDTETVLANDANAWIRIPMSRIDRILVDDAGIEFTVGSLKLLFHREGFDGPDAWERACQTARSIPLTASSATPSIDRPKGLRE